MKTCQCKKPIKLKEPLKLEDVIAGHVHVAPDLHVPLTKTPPKVMTGSRAMVSIGGTVIGTFSDATLEYRAFKCPSCNGRGWIPTTKDEKKLLGILE